MSDTAPKPAQRSTYRHGALREALLEAGVAMAREGGGPQAIVLREASRRAGVAPNATYTHFKDREALVQAVARYALAQLAATMTAEQDAITATDDATVTARARFRAVGAGYIRFAREEPGLFRTAFATQHDVSAVAEPDAAGPTGRSAIELLTDALNGLVETGLLTPESRAGAEFLAWPTVHGLAYLAIDGPLRFLEPAQLDDLTNQLLDMLDRGI
ncbi:TetR/AcrR family transcriptional regulator [Nocardia camponoti]|uniref:TetR family transcriptional regulator n=1 Tax=Nocardia camponoti TaxID=1616106 RepID=A0A917QJI3_9NOCA|nr:TetR-like C-terminal domain-containing protein [Nocardia camponoti]GGK53930.1 TetR family transcriptional regulator [Nocardia camponoti]